MPVKRPHTTLIISQTADGCLISSDSSAYDKFPEWKNTPFIRALLQQFFEFTSASPHAASLINATMLIKAGVEQTHTPSRSNLNLIILDPQALLSTSALNYLSLSTKKLIIVSSHHHNTIPKNKNLFQLKINKNKLNLEVVLINLYKVFRIHEIYIQSSGPQNRIWLETELLDDLTIITHPIIAGPNGASFILPPEIKFIPLALRLISTKIFDDHYLISRYSLVYQDEFPTK